MCTKMAVSELVNLSINWVRSDDKRLDTIFSSLKSGNEINEPINLLNCGCGKTYMLNDGGHRITAAYKHYQKTGIDVLIPVRKHVSSFD